MSGHDVGRAMNSVGKVVLRLYDEGRLPLEEAREILIATKNGVHWCDGNEYEGTAQLSKNHCGHCLRKFDVGTPPYSIWDLTWGLPDRNRLDCHPEMPLASSYLCSECFDRLFELHTGDSEAGPRQRTTIEECVPVQDWHAIADEDSRLGFGW